MSVFLYLEASQPCGTRYRFGLGCQVPPSLVSMMLMISRLFWMRGHLGNGVPFSFRQGD